MEIHYINNSYLKLWDYSKVNYDYYLTPLDFLVYQR